MRLTLRVFVSLHFLKTHRACISGRKDVIVYIMKIISWSSKWFLKLHHCSHTLTKRRRRGKKTSPQHSTQSRCCQKASAVAVSSPRSVPYTKSCSERELSEPSPHKGAGALKRISLLCVHVYVCACACVSVCMCMCVR